MNSECLELVNISERIIHKLNENITCVAISVDNKNLMRLEGCS